MNIKHLKVGDKVFIREDLEVYCNYGGYMYMNEMKSGVGSINEVFSDGAFRLKGIHKNFYYTPEMIDWEKTRVLNNSSCFKEITQSGESGNEITKAIGYDEKEVMVKNNNEKNDIEKAVMLLMLKNLGVTYSEIKKEVKKVKVKWTPAIGEQFYYISTTPTLKARALTYFTEGALKEMTDVGNYFRTKEDAEEKIEKIKEILKGE